MSARAEDAARALSREQPTTADAAVPAPANNGSADAEGVEIPAPEPSGNKTLLHGCCALMLRSLQPSADRSGKALGCPVCRVETKVKCGQAGSLPKNYLVRLSTAAEPGQRSCDRR